MPEPYVQEFWFIYSVVGPGLQYFLTLSDFNSGFPGGSAVKESTLQCQRQRRHGFIPRWGRSPGGGHGNPIQYSFLENPWWATIHRVTKSRTQVKLLSTHALTQVILMIDQSWDPRKTLEGKDWGPGRWVFDPAHRKQPVPVTSHGVKTAHPWAWGPGSPTRLHSGITQELCQVLPPGILI